MLWCIGTSFSFIKSINSYTSFELSHKCIIAHPFYRLRLFHPDMPPEMLAGGYNSKDSLHFYRRKIGVQTAGGEGRVDVHRGADSLGVNVFLNFFLGKNSHVLFHLEITYLVTSALTAILTCRVQKI